MSKTVKELFYVTMMGLGFTGTIVGMKGCKNAEETLSAVQQTIDAEADASFEGNTGLVKTYHTVDEFNEAISEVKGSAIKGLKAVKEKDNNMWLVAVSSIVTLGAAFGLSTATDKKNTPKNTL